MLSLRTFTLGSTLALLCFAFACTWGGSPEGEESAPEAASSEEPEAAASSPEPGAEEVEAAEASSDIEPGAIPVVELQTSKGVLHIELYPDKAPESVENFLKYVNDGFYDGTIFHRVVPDFVIQGGGFTAEMDKKSTREPIQNEADNGLRNLRGTICMARTQDPHSATSQFFINTKDNPPLDHRGKTMDGWGYAVFGKVTEGLEVVDAIEGVPRTRVGPYSDVPVEPIVIESARVLE